MHNYSRIASALCFTLLCNQFKKNQYTLTWLTIVKSYVDFSPFSHSFIDILYFGWTKNEENQFQELITVLDVVKKGYPEWLSVRLRTKWFWVRVQLRLSRSLRILVCNCWSNKSYQTGSCSWNTLQLSSKIFCICYDANLSTNGLLVLNIVLLKMVWQMDGW